MIQIMLYINICTVILINLTGGKYILYHDIAGPIVSNMTPTTHRG